MTEQNLKKNHRRISGLAVYAIIVNVSALLGYFAALALGSDPLTEIFEGIIMYGVAPFVGILILITGYQLVMARLKTSLEEGESD